MRRLWPVFLLLLLALCGVWFWSLGSLPHESASEVTVAAVEGGVTVKYMDEVETPVQVGDQLEEGATITTNSDGKVTLDWFGEGETRLGISSRLVVRTASQSEDGPLVVRLRLESGRAWTRVLRLLDIDDDVSVETSDVVATVRGTSFDVQTSPGTATTIWVADSVVEASGATVVGHPDGFFIAEGSMAEFTSGHGAAAARPLSDADRITSWFLENSEADAQFHKRALSRMKVKLATEGAPTSGLRRSIVEWSEGLRVRFSSGERRERLANRYSLRRLMIIRRIVEEGKSGLAYQEFARMDGEINARLESEAPNAELRKTVSMAQRLFQDVEPSSPAYRIKQQVEEWSIRMAQTSAGRLHARLMTIDSRLDEAVRAMKQGRLEIASQVLILARQGLANVDRERRDAKEMTSNNADRLRKIWKALSIRADRLDERIISSDAPSATATPEMGEAESTSASSTSSTFVLPLVSTSTKPPPVIEPIMTEPLPEPPAPAKPVSMSLTPGKLTIGLNERVTYRAILVYDTGLTKDVTNSARFTMSPTGYGALNNNIFSATVLQGSIVINATYEEAGVPLQGQATLIIKQ